MQNQNPASLNAVRVFVVVAQRRSISKAADDLCVTPSAVSHQVKKLESDLGVALFERTNNRIGLTEAGQGFFEDVAPAVSILERSIRSMRRDADEIVLRVSTTFAVRRLIPALHRFRSTCPDARVRIETDTDIDVPIGPHADAAICYRRPANCNMDGEVLIVDRSVPVLSPTLLKSSNYRSVEDIVSIPALQCTAENWDWMHWASNTGIDFRALRIKNAFDNDDAALHAAAAGLGMVLSPLFMIREALASGMLIAVPGFSPVEFGRYHFVSNVYERPIVRKLRSWLQEELAEG